MDVMSSVKWDSLFREQRARLQAWGSSESMLKLIDLKELAVNTEK